MINLLCIGELNLFFNQYLLSKHRSYPVVPTKFLYLASIFQNISASKLLIASEVFYFGLPINCCAYFQYNATLTLDVSKMKLKEKQ